MLTTALLLTLAAAPPTGAARLTTLPLPSEDPAHTALGRAVGNAAFAAAQARGMVAVDVSSVRPIEEAIAACAKDRACRITEARRLGVRFVLLPVVEGERARVLLVDLQTGEQRTRELRGDRRTTMAMATAVVDELLEEAAPRAAFVRTQALERAAVARAGKDLEAEERALSEAIAAGPLDDEAADLMLARVRVIERKGDALAADAEWDVLIDTLRAPGPAPAGAGATLEEATRQRVLESARAHLLARASAIAEHEPLAAARKYARAGELFGDVDSRFMAAELYRSGGAPEQAELVLRSIVDDEGTPADLRLRALTALHGG